ncbi:MAG: YCF48-related protein [bacterium]
MSFKSKFNLLALNLFLLTFLTGCGINIGSNNTTTASRDFGGLFFSESKGDKWVQKSSMMSTTKVSSFSGTDIVSFAADPADRRALYVGTLANGLFFSLDSGIGWQKSVSLGNVLVRSIAIDPQFSCTIYVAIGNRLQKSVDCSRTWQPVYVDNDKTVTISAVVIDPKNGGKVYLTTSRGEVLKSQDRGSSWKPIYRIQGKISKLFINPRDGQNMYAASEKYGLSVTTDGGANWTTLEKPLKAFDEGASVKDLVFSGMDVNRLFIATKYGLLKTDNGGKNWTKIDLITPKVKATINALAVNPQNDLEIYYVTNTTFYRSVDGGKAWTTKELPTSRIGSTLWVDPEVANWIFMGVKALVQ